MGDSKEDDEDDASALPWPARCFGTSSFECLERCSLGRLRPGGAAAATGASEMASLERRASTDSAASGDGPMTNSEALEAMGVLEDEAEADIETTTEALAALSLADTQVQPYPADKIKAALQLAHELLLVDSNLKG